MDPNEYVETVKPPKGIYEEKAMRDLEARCKFFMEKVGHYAALNEEDEDPVKKILLEKGLKHEKIEKIKKLYPKTYQRYLDKKLMHKDNNDARTKRDHEDSGGKKDKRREELDKYLDELFEEEMAEAYNKQDKNDVKDHRCNCENLHCKHGEEACKNKSGHKKAMYVGSICDECAKNMPEKYMVK